MAKEIKKTKKVAAKPAKAKEKKVVKKTVAPKTKAVKPVKKAVVKEEKKVKEAVKTVAKKPEKKPKKNLRKDSGSIDFQIKNFTEKIESLSKHLKVHQHDFDSRRGLLIMVGKRRRLLNYLKKAEPEKYTKVITNLKLKR